MNTTTARAAMSKSIDVCRHPLLGGRLCCHVKNAPVIEYEYCGVPECAHGYGVRGTMHRHSRTWHDGDARYTDIGDQLVDMETGESIGYLGELAQRIIAEISGGRIEPSADEKQAQSRRVLEMYGAKFADQAKPRATPPDGYHWYFESSLKAIGTDNDGHDVEFSFTDGKIQRIYSLNQRHEAVAYARRYGMTKAARTLDIPVSTIHNWLARAK